MTHTTTLDPTDGLAFVKEVEQLGRSLIRVREGVGRLIFGQEEVVDEARHMVLKSMTHGFEATQF